MHLSSERHISARMQLKKGEKLHFSFSLAGAGWPKGRVVFAAVLVVVAAVEKKVELISFMISGEEKESP